MRKVDEIILEEIRELRSEVSDLKTQLALFKGKAFGMLSVVSAFFTVFWSYVNKKL